MNKFRDVMPQTFQQILCRPDCIGHQSQRFGVVGGGVNSKLPQTKIYTHSGQNGDQTWLPLQSVDIQESTLGKGLLFLFSLLRAYTEHIFTCIA